MDKPRALCVTADCEAGAGTPQGSLDRKRRVLGEDHPDTLRSADNLALDLRTLGVADDGQQRNPP